MSGLLWLSVSLCQLGCLLGWHVGGRLVGVVVAVVFYFLVSFVLSMLFQYFLGGMAFGLIICNLISEAAPF